MTKRKTLETKVKAKRLTPAEQHARFVETARKVGASEDPTEFDKAFKKVTDTKTARKSS